MDKISSFCSGYITALCLLDPDWDNWGVPLSIDCCSIDLIREEDKVNVIVFKPSGRREEFYMVPQLNVYGDYEWVRE